MGNFNASVWNALWILALPGIAVFAIAYRLVRKGRWYFFDPKHSTGSSDAGDFGSHYARYQDIAKLAIALSGGAIAFLINTIVSQKPPIDDYDVRIDAVTPIVVGFFGLAISLLISFMVLLSVWYEEYCHSRLHNTYTAWRYATVQALGAMGLLSFLLGFGWLAVNLFR